MLVADYFDRLAAREVPIIVDTYQAAKVVARHGFTALPCHNRDYLPGDIRFALRLRCMQGNDALDHAVAQHANAIVTYLTTTPYDTGESALDYSMSRLRTLCMQKTLERRSVHYLSLLTCRTPVLHTAGHRLTCHLDDPIERCKAIASLRAGQLYAVKDFLSLPIVRRSTCESSTVLDGDFAFDGLAYHFASPTGKRITEPFFAEIMGRCTRGRNRLVIKENVLACVVVNGDDVTSEFSHALGLQHTRMEVSELVLGCGDFGLPTNWRINSPLNEGTYGACVTVGIGVDAPTVAFVSEGAILQA
jgi:hypothetical protein